MAEGMFSSRTTGLGSYSFDLPNVYQVELVGGVCNLKCPLCPVTLGKAKRKNPFFDVDTLKVMVERGDFDNTFYTELQMYGEPALHPKMKEAVMILKDAGIKVGVSTNGTVWNEGLKYVDFITLSADSVMYRVGRDDEKFSEVVQKILTESEAKIDVQVVEIGDWKEQIERLKETFKGYEDRVLIRTIPDTFGYRKEEISNIDDFCINILTSVSIQSDGDVTVCCFDWGKELVIGNVYEQSLREIWNGERRKELVRRWLTGDLPEKCKYCKYRSPQLLHWRFWVNWSRRGWI